MSKMAGKILLPLLVFLMGAVGAAEAATAYFIEVNGIITSTKDKYVKKGLDDAVAAEAAVYVIKLNTPGGVLDSTRSIVQTILESPIPVVVFVSPQGAHAGSAGTFITLAANYAVMAEGTNIGAAHPVSATGEDITGDMRSKTTNDTVSFMRSISEKRGRNIEEAILTVTESKSFTASEALEAGIIDWIVNSDDELLDKLAEVLETEGSFHRINIEPTITEKLAFGLSDPNVLVLLFFIGVLMIFLEFKMPGTFIFAGVGIVAIILFLIGINFIPINYLGLILIIAGVGLLIAEVFVPAYGLLAVAGVASFAGGVMLLFDTAQTQGVGVSLWLMAVMVLVLLAVVFFIGRLIVKDMKRKPVVGLNSLTGKTGRVMQWEGNEGKIYIQGEIWNAKSDFTFDKNDRVRVSNVNDLLLTVVPDEEELS